MSDLSEVEFSHEPIKPVIETYPEPRCDPRKNIIILPPAAANPVLDLQPGLVYRGSSRPRPRTPKKPVAPSSPDSVSAACESTPRPCPAPLPCSTASRQPAPSVPYARSSAQSAPQSRSTTPSFGPPREFLGRTARSPAVRNGMTGGGRWGEASGDRHSIGSGGKPREHERGFPRCGASLPSHAGMQNVCSPATRTKGNAYLRKGDAWAQKKS